MLQSVYFWSLLYFSIIRNFTLLYFRAIIKRSLIILYLDWTWLIRSLTLQERAPTITIRNCCRDFYRFWCHKTSTSHTPSVCMHRKRGDNNLFYLNNCIWIPDSISGNYCTLETLAAFHPTCFWWSFAKFSSGVYWAAIVLCARGNKIYYECLNCTISIHSNLNHGNNSWQSRVDKSFC